MKLEKFKICILKMCKLLFLNIFKNIFLWIITDKSKKYTNCEFYKSKCPYFVRFAKNS